jgi:hypothetical protein
MAFLECLWSLVIFKHLCRSANHPSSTNGRLSEIRRVYGRNSGLLLGIIWIGINDAIPQFTRDLFIAICKECSHYMLQSGNASSCKALIP